MEEQRKHEIAYLLLKGMCRREGCVPVNVNKILQGKGISEREISEFMKISFGELIDELFPNDNGEKLKNPIGFSSTKERAT